MTDFLADKRKEITDRLDKLRPSVEEYHRLDAAVKALDDLPSSPAGAKSRRGPGRPPGSKSRKPAAAKVAKAQAANGRRKPKAAAGRRAGRRKGSGGRAAEALRFITEQPGITIPELARKMGIKQNYLYRVLPGLEQNKRVRKEGRGWHPGGPTARAA